VNLQLDHFPMIFSNTHKKNLRLVCAPRAYSNTTKKYSFFAARTPAQLRAFGARLSQRVAMDDLASYFVEERSKVR
jgi:hypothetical protein